MANTIDQSDIDKTEAREKFADVSSTTLTPARIVVMCFERIDRDLRMAESAISRGAGSDAHQYVAHAQEIISHLLEGIVVSDWEGAEKLSLIYTWSFGELLSASVRLDPARISTVRTLLDTIGGAFTQAAAAVAVSADTNGVTLAAKA